MTTTTIERVRTGDIAILRISGDVTSASDTELTDGFGAALDDGARAVSARGGHRARLGGAGSRRERAAAAQ